MVNKTQTAKVLPAERIRGLAVAHRRWLRLAAAGISGYLMAGSFLFGGVSPFGVALSASLEGGEAMVAAAGAFLGYLVRPGMLYNFPYMAALALVVCAKWLFGGRLREKWGPLGGAGTCLVCLGICSVAGYLLGESTPYDAILLVAELLLGCGGTYFFARAMDVLPKGIRSSNKADLSSVVIAGCVVLMALTPVAIAGLSLGRMLGVLAILLCAGNGKEAGGAVAGVAAGVSVGLAGGDYAYAMGAYAFGGLAAGIFGNAGRIATAAAFIVINTGTALLTMEFSQVNAAIFEVFIASLAYVAIPAGVQNRLPLAKSAAPVPESEARSVLSEQMGELALALREIGETTRTVSQKLDSKREPGPTGLIGRVADRVCAPCGMKTSCWQLRHAVTRKGLEEAIATLRKGGILSREQLPKHFQQHCCRMDELTAELNAQFAAYLAREGVQRKVAKVRAVLTDQFEGMARMLEEYSAEVGATRPLDTARTERVREYISHQGIHPHRLSCTIDRFSRIKVELVVPGYQAVKVHQTRTTLDLCSLLEVDFDPPEVKNREKQTTFTFCEKAAYSVELGAYQLASGGNRLCGDAYDYIRNQGGCAHFILSDGMGSGGNAAVDSNMACGLLVRLISVGVGYEAALKMVNSALLVKSGEESLATIDACTLDLFSGKAVFYKAGAAPTFLIKGGKTGYVESASLPAGILHGVSFEESSVTLHEGDIVVMVSDGVTSTGADWVKSEIAALREGDMQRLCEKIAVTAKLRRADGHEDDITVIAAALRKAG